MKDSGNFDCQLTLAIPAALEEEVVDHLLATGLPIHDLLLLPVETPAALAPPLTAMERVRGRTARRMIVILLAQSHVAALIASLQEAMPSADISWWSTPLSASGTTAGGEA